MLRPAALLILTVLVPTAPAAAAAPDASGGASCETQIEGLELDAPSPRLRRYLEGLPEVVVEARVGHALYLAFPEPTATSRTAIEHAARPDRVLRGLVAGGDRARLREAALVDGYFFAERPALARALSSQVRLEALFDAPTIQRWRDGAQATLTRQPDGTYAEADGTRATLRLNDRVAIDAADLGPARHLDLEVVRQRTGALRTIPTALSADAAALDLVFPDGSRRAALVRLDRGATEVGCVGGDRATLRATLDDAARFAARQARITAAARALVRESPRFDEPVNEPEGVQEDGRLREAWLAAYGRGERTFTYRDHAYAVFDADGNPRPPQVCIDFVFDSWERSEGTWFRPAGEAPGRTGAVRFRGVPRRSIQQLLEHSATDATFERLDVASADRVPLQESRRFARAMTRLADDVRPGDALVIYGLRLQDMRNHYHAVLVLEVEPMTGVPMTVADNQGRPHLRTLTSAMRAAPLRSIAHRVRVDFDALEGAVAAR
ncbi:MAG: hypothetical protein KC619_22145 [Myxococcales bacterium]|nr:hypothetical protein [Myxococcales bacterium]